MFIYFGANSQLQDYSLVKIHKKEKETTLKFKVVSRSGGIWLESWWIGSDSEIRLASFFLPTLLSEPTRLLKSEKVSHPHGYWQK